MSKQDDKWIEIVREKLDNYSPVYNASDWAKLAGKISAASGGHVWLLSKLISSVKVILVSTLIITSVAVSTYLYTKKDTKKNNKTTNTIINENKTGNITTSDNSKSESAKTKVLEIANNIDKNIIEKKGQNNSQTKKESGDNENKNNSTGVILTNKNLVPTPDNNNNLSKEEKRTMIPYNGTTQTVKSANENRSFNQHNKQKERPDKTSFAKLTPATFIADNKISTNRLTTPIRQNTMPATKTKKIKEHIEKPFYAGISYSGFYTNNTEWQQNKYLSLFGLTFEKYIFKKISISFNPKLSVNGIATKHTDYETPEDSLYTPVYIDSSEVYTSKLSFIEMPLLVNYNFYSGKKFNLLATIGVTSKYTFSSSNNLSDDLKQYNNKFTFAQAGIFSIKYERKLNDNLFFDFEPFFEFPIRKEPEIFNKNFYGFNLCLKFKLF